MAFRALHDRGRDFFVPFNAADKDKDGDCAEANEGGMKRLRCSDRLELRLLVGERPAAGADAGVDDLTKVLRRGVERAAVLRRGFVGGLVKATSKEYRGDLAIDTSSWKADLLRLCKQSRIFGSTFSPSEPPSISGEGARRFNGVGAELVMIAAQMISPSRPAAY